VADSLLQESANADRTVAGRLVTRARIELVRALEALGGPPELDETDDGLGNVVPFPARIA
jgi:hypothetical protein